jgi:5-methyltetrahydropteroyltriglutamate--homocysteine methyltransferase
LGQWAEVVSPDRLLAGVDCGFSVHVGTTTIDPDVVFAKLAALSQGCEIASKRLFA